MNNKLFNKLVHNNNKEYLKLNYRMPTEYEHNGILKYIKAENDKTLVRSSVKFICLTVFSFALYFWCNRILNTQKLVYIVPFVVILLTGTLSLMLYTAYIVIVSNHLYSDIFAGKYKLLNCYVVKATANLKGKKPDRFFKVHLKELGTDNIVDKTVLIPIDNNISYGTPVKLVLVNKNRNYFTKHMTFAYTNKMISELNIEATSLDLNV